MLKTPAPFPHVGSYALFIDDGRDSGSGGTGSSGHLPHEPQRAELVRIMARGSTGNLNTLPMDSAVTVAFPLRVGASGTKTVWAKDLIDATPLTRAEEEELKSLHHLLCAEQDGARRRKTNKVLRAEKLRTRQIYSEVMRYELAKLERLERRAQPSTGSRLPKEAA